MKTNRRKIVHVITSSQPFGGAQRNTLLSVKGLQQDGYDVELICGPGGQLIDEAQTIGIPVHVMENLVRPLVPFKDTRAFFQLYRLFRSKRYHVVHTHSVKAGLLGRMAAWLAGIPVIIHTIHGVPFVIGSDLQSRIYLIYERLVGYVTKKVVCVGEVLRQEVLDWKVRLDQKLVTIYSGIEFSSYVPQRPAFEIKEQLGIEGCWPIVGSVGRLTECKAQHYLIEAVGLLTAKYPHLKLLFVGEGELRPFLDRRVQELGLEQHVLLLGEKDCVADYLNIFDVYVMSSVFEGVGRALTEAMYWGLPIVATPVYGVKEVILHEDTGLLAAPRDPQALAVAMDRLFSDPVLAKRLGSNAKRKAEDLMGGDRMIADLERLYSEA
jgi:glycosyltransferase involved in cell wall biosynthesis